MWHPGVEQAREQAKAKRRAEALQLLVSWTELSAGALMREPLRVTVYRLDLSRWDRELARRSALPTAA